MSLSAASIPLFKTLSKMTGLYILGLRGASLALQHPLVTHSDHSSTHKRHPEGLSESPEASQKIFRSSAAIIFFSPITRFVTASHNVKPNRDLKDPQTTKRSQQDFPEDEDFQGQRRH